MASLNYECIPLQWDTDYFGIRSARVNLYGSVGESGQDEIIEFCKAYDFTTIANFNNNTENNYWIGEKTGAFLADVNIQFLKVLANKPGDQDGEIYVVNKYPPNEQILEIARKSFRFSRFFNDQRLPKTQAKNIYSYWTQCAFGQKDKYFVICEKDGKIVGYILFSINEDDSVIQLIAVNGKYQGQKIGRTLVQTLEMFLIQKGINKIKVGTQLNNIAASQFYNAIGFKYAGCSSVYHLWRKDKL